jgi:hypothetical protein
LNVPITIEVWKQGVTTRRADGVKHATVVSISERDAEDGGGFLDFSTAHITASHCVCSLMHVAVHDVGYVELPVEVFWEDTSWLPFDTNDLCFTIFFVEFDHFTKNGVPDFRCHNWL